MKLALMMTKTKHRGRLAPVTGSTMTMHEVYTLFRCDLSMKFNARSLSLYTHNFYLAHHFGHFACMSHTMASHAGKMAIT